MSILESVRSEARRAPASGIAAVMTYGRGRPGLIPLWAGEGDLPTPDFISDAAAKALRDGETFYTWQGGTPELRDALARYHERHFGKSFARDEFLVVGSGMQAIQLALQATAGAGDEVICLTPAWPNFAGATEVAGAKAVSVPLGQSANGWFCDIDRLSAAVNSRTRAIFVNSPANPTGWTADHATLQSILDLARRRNLWIIADEIYALFHYEGSRAPSFLDIMEPDDRILFVNTFSKNWALKAMFENLIQYSTSGVATFMQRAGIAALDDGAAFVASQVVRARQARDIVCGKLAETGKARFSVPTGAFYLFFSIDDIADAGQAALDIVDQANVGLAPGTAFGEGGDNAFRLCFHRRLDEVEEAAQRLARWIGSR